MRDAELAALAADSLGRFGKLSLRLGGTSMLPAVHPGDVAHFIPVNDKSPVPGDIVLFRREGRLVAHRVVSCTAGHGLLTRGDGLAAMDAPVAAEDLIGSLVGLSRRGQAVSWHHSPRIRDSLGRWLIRRSWLATRLYLRWQRLTARTAT